MAKLEVFLTEQIGTRDENLLNWINTIMAHVPVDALASNVLCKQAPKQDDDNRFGGNHEVDDLI